MTGRQDEPPRGPGFAGWRGEDGGFGAIEIAAAAASLGWLALVGAIRLFGGDADPGDGGSLGTLLTVVAVVLPVATIWIAALTARTARTLRAEAERLRASLDAIRNAWVAQAQGGVGRTTTAATTTTTTAPPPAAAVAPPAAAVVAHPVPATPDEPNAERPATFTSRRDGAPADRRPPPPPAAAAPAEDQPALALGTPAEVPHAPVGAADFIRALNFPDSQDDREGFAALRRALDDRNLAKLIRAAQDVLTLLSQDGIYMDDLAPDRARPEVWRRFAQGERGRGIAALGGVRDRSSLALTAARMRADTVFRDAAHHFLRQFDKTVSAFEPNASDAEISALAETRTARAFMLLGRVTGTFD